VHNADAALLPMAIASDASVTVSIAAEQSGSASEFARELRRGVRFSRQDIRTRGHQQNVVEG